MSTQEALDRLDEIGAQVLDVEREMEDEGEGDKAGLKEQKQLLEDERTEIMKTLQTRIKQEVITEDKPKVKETRRETRIIAPMEKYKSGNSQDFNKHCQRFKLWVDVGKVVNENMAGQFLLYVDQETADELDEVYRALKGEEKNNVDLFTKRFMNVFKPKMGGLMMKRALSAMKKGESETTSSYTSRIRTAADDAYGEEDSTEKEVASFNAFIDGLDKEMMTKMMEANVESFSEAVIQCKRVEEIKTTGRYER